MIFFFGLWLIVRACGVRVCVCVCHWKHSPAVLLSLRVKTSMFLWAFVTLWACATAWFLGSCQCVCGYAWAHVQALRSMHACARLCLWSRRRFVTAALLIFATIKTPCGAQCSESQHWDSAHLDPMVHHTSHDKCERVCVCLWVSMWAYVNICANV